MININSGDDWTFDKLQETYAHIEKIAIELMGIDPKKDIYPNQIEIVSYEQMLDAYSRHGMPIGYDHWTIGEQFVKQSHAYKHRRMGLAFEIVLNSSPCLAYLMEQNTMPMQALVIAHACVSGDTEYLSPTGWKRISEYNGGFVAQYNKDGTANFVEPTKFIKREQADFIHVNGDTIEQKITDDHRVVFINGLDTLVEISGKELLERHDSKTRGFNGRFITGFNLKSATGLPLSNDEIRLCIAIKADGSYTKKIDSGHFNCVEHHRVRFHLKKTRKIERLEQLLARLKIEYTKSPTYDGRYSIVFNYHTRINKRFDYYWYLASPEQLRVIGEEVLHWDGSETNRKFSSKYKEDVDYIQFVWSSLGKHARIVKGTRCWEVLFSDNHLRTVGATRGSTSAREVKEFERVRSIDGFAYCFTVPSGMFVTRLNDRISVTGNCIGHNFVFKNNYLFQEWTDAEGIIDYLVFAQRYVRQCEEQHGAKEVEKMLDAAHALQYHGIDKYKRPSKLSASQEEARREEREKYLQSQLNEIWNSIPKNREGDVGEAKKFVKEPQENILYFLEKNAPRLETWQREIIRIVRRMSQYFYPQIQTKVLNEGFACVTGDTLIDTPNGFFRADELVETHYSGQVEDGETLQIVSNWFKHEQKERIKIVTSHGYVLHGGYDHRIFNDGEWIKLSDLKVGDTLSIHRGSNNWPTDYVEFPKWEPQSRITIKEMCEAQDISQTTYWRSLKYPHKVATSTMEICEKIRREYLDHVHLPAEGTVLANRSECRFPKKLDERVAYFLGMLIGDGMAHDSGSPFINLTNQDSELLSSFNDTVSDVFGITCSTRADRNHFNVKCYSASLVEWLCEECCIKTGYVAGIKEVPSKILKSPRSVVAAFIRGHVDTDGCVTESGDIILVSKSQTLLLVEQQLLLKMGIVCSVKHQRQDGCYRLYIGGSDSKLFDELIGVGLSRKRQRLKDAIANKQWYLPKVDTTRIIEIVQDVGTTYDFSVENTHKYKASAFINHNCYTHYTIINEMYNRGLMTAGAMLEFQHSHTSVILQPDHDSDWYSGSLNPYAIGFAIYRDIERISLNPTAEDRHWFRNQDWVGNGKPFENCKFAASNFKDDSFILQYLSPKVMRDMKLFAIHDDDEEEYIEISGIHNEHGYEEIRSKLAKTYDINQFIPNIQITDVDIWDSRTMMLEHIVQGRRLLEEKNVESTLAHLAYLWGYPVVLSAIDSQTKELLVEWESAPEQDVSVDFGLSDLAM